MEFENLKNAVKLDNQTRLNKELEKIKTEEGFNEVNLWYGKKYKTNPQEKLKKFILKTFEKELKIKLDKISEVEKYESIKFPFVITIEWKNSKMWGSNPRAYTNYGFIGSSIGGCGYDKLSTATAEALNSNNTILKYLYAKEDGRLKSIPNTSRRDFIGYGSGYGIIPYFEGGVGVDCFKNIIDGLGLVWENITSTSNTDVYRISQ